MIISIEKLNELREESLYDLEMAKRKQDEDQLHYARGKLQVIEELLEENN